MIPKIGYLIRDKFMGYNFEFYPENTIDIDDFKYEYEIKRIVYFELEDE